MAKISNAARAHAQKVKAQRLMKKHGVARKPRRNAEEELGDDLLSSIPIIGPLLGGLLGGGGGGDQKSASAAAPGTAGGMMAMSPSPNGGPSLENIRGVVQDALGVFGDVLGQRDASAQRALGTARAASDAIFGALDPTLKAARGGTQVQRLQSEATSEHNSIQRREARQRQEDERYATVQQKLDRLVATAAAIQSRLGGRVVIATDPVVRDILGVR